ncbi:hypothetical protein [Streptomyces sp. NPDC057115]|uniref:hypothetical protein n=1 Tax=Streptomyces sp. NPDC057115 TaxID=3346022 RepID=UPI00362E21F8
MAAHDDDRTRDDERMPEDERTYGDDRAHGVDRAHDDGGTPDDGRTRDDERMPEDERTHDDGRTHGVDRAHDDGGTPDDGRTRDDERMPEDERTHDDGRTHGVDRAHDDGRTPDDGRAHGVDRIHDHDRIHDDDPLMLAILAETPPADARRDPAFLAEHEAALADLAVLREQLALLGDVLTEPVDAVPGEGGHEAPADRTGPTDRTPTDGTPTDRAPTDRAPTDGPHPGAHPPPSPHRPRGHEARAPRGSRGPSGRSGTRPRRPRRPLRVALGSLAVAAAAAFVAGLGWLVVQPGATQDASSADAGVAAGDRSSPGAAEDAPAPPGAEQQDPVGSARRLACARLVAEGTVTAVRPVPGADGRRVTLAVTRVHKGEEGAPVTFLLGASAESSPGVGDEVLVVLPGEGDRPDLLVTGAQNVALARAWVTATLPEADRLACQ